MICCKIMHHCAKFQHSFFSFKCIENIAACRLKQEMKGYIGCMALITDCIFMEMANFLMMDKWREGGGGGGGGVISDSAWIQLNCP